MTLPPAAKPLALQVVPDHQREGVLDRGHEIEVQEVLQEAEVPPASVLGKLVQRPFATPQGIASPSPASQLLGHAVQMLDLVVFHQLRLPPSKIFSPRQPLEPLQLSSQQVALRLPLPPRGGCLASRQLLPHVVALLDLLDPSACLLHGRSAAAAPSSRSWGPATSNEGGLQKLFGLITCGYGKSLKSDRQKTAAHVVP